MTSAGVVIFDIDSGVADMPAHAWLVHARPGAWQEFSAHVAKAAVVDAGRAVVQAVAGLGFTVVYSSTRPFSAAEATREWLAVHEFPRPAAVYTRPAGDATASALLDKVRHCEVVRRRLRNGHLAAFVDDDPEIAAQLRVQGQPGTHFAQLANLGPTELHELLIGGHRVKCSHEKDTAGG